MPLKLERMIMESQLFSEKKKCEGLHWHGLMKAWVKKSINITNTEFSGLTFHEQEFHVGALTRPMLIKCTRSCIAFDGFSSLVRWCYTPKLLVSRTTWKLQNKKFELLLILIRKWSFIGPLSWFQVTMERVDSCISPWFIQEGGGIVSLFHPLSFSRFILINDVVRKTQAFHKRSDLLWEFVSEKKLSSTVLTQGSPFTREKSEVPNPKIFDNHLFLLTL